MTRSPPGGSTRILRPPSRTPGGASSPALTKRSKRLAELAPSLPWPANVWIGTSIETDRYSYRADHLPTVGEAAVRFLSLETLLGPLPSLDLTGVS